MNNEHAMPMCYIHGSHELHPCDVPLCNVTVDSRECKLNKKGSCYTGMISHSRSGYTCQAWNEQSPHKHYVGISDEEFPDKNVSTAKNYCRNPNNARWDLDPHGPYCYTTNPDVVFEYCDIPMCNQPEPEPSASTTILCEDL